MDILEMIRELGENDGLTLKNGKSVVYRSGWQVATEGKEARNPETAAKLVESYKGSCGVWFSEGIYYVDKSRRVNTKKEAMQIGKLHNQISVLSWQNMKLAYC